MKKIVKISGWVGILASLLMFAGDMFLYYTAEPIQKSAEAYLLIMSKVGHLRLLVGGLLGPLSAFLYCIGFYHLSLSIKPEYVKSRLGVFGILSLGMFFGGAYHSHFTHLGILSALKLPTALEQIQATMAYYFLGAMLPTFIVTIILVVNILKKRTYYPRWMAVFTPSVLVIFGLVFEGLPQPFYIIIAGGWYNLLYTLIFAISLTLLPSRVESGLGL